MLLGVAASASLLLVSHVLFAHFEPFAPKWRQLLKYALAIAAAAAIGEVFGPWGLAALLAAFALPATVIHAWWLPRHGVNGLTGEPRDRYYALRGWPPPNDPLRET